jgi:hypothetical protein
MGWYISDLQHEYYQFATAGIDGAKHIEVGFPTALNHKESDFEKFMKEHQAGIKELYHYAGTTIDHATENIVKDYNRHATPENQINWETPEPHARRWFSPRFIEDGTTKGLEFTFGGTEYRLVKGNNGNWYASLQKSGVFLGAKVVEKELTELEYRIADLLQEAANNILK